MPRLNLAKKLCALGLLAILYSSNVAYANAKDNENRVVSPAKERTSTLTEDRSSKPLTIATAKTTVPSTRKKGLPTKSLTAAANSCACSCPTPSSRTAAAAGPWWDCVKGCLRSWGVSVVQIIACGTICATGLIPPCAVCIGVDVTIVILCSIGCATYAGVPGKEEGIEPILVGSTKRSKKRTGERRTLAFAERK